MKDINVLLKFIFPFWKKYWKIEMVVFGLLSIYMACQIVIPRKFQVLIDSISSFDSDSKFAQNLLVFSSIVLSAIILSWLFQIMVTWIGESLIIDITSKTYSSILNRKRSFWMQYEPHDVLTRLTQDILSVKSIMVDFFHNAFYQLALMIGITIVLFSMSAKVGIVLLFSIPVLFVVAYFGNKWLDSTATKARQIASGFMQLFHMGIRNPMLNHSWNLNDYHLGRYQKHASSMRKTQIEWVNKNRGIDFIVSFISLLFSSVLVLIVIRSDFQSGGYTTGELFALIMYSGQVTEVVISFANLLVSTKMNRVSSLRIKSMHDFTESEKKISNPERESVTHPYFKSEMEKGVKLPETTNYIYKLSAGNGTGKSTYSQYLSGFDDLSDTFPDNKWCVLCADPLLFQGTLLENIIIISGMELSEKEIINCLELNQLYSLLKVFPEGFNTQISDSSEKISQGQKQAVALIGIVLLNPDRLVIDEALNSLDQSIKSEIRTPLLVWMNKRKIVLIEHDNYLIDNNAKQERVGVRA